MTLLATRMASSVGRIEPIDPSNGKEWTNYIENLEYYFLANGIQVAGKKQAVLISVMGPQAYKMLRNLISPGTHNESCFSNSWKPYRIIMILDLPK